MVIPTGVDRNDPSALITFKGAGDARRLFYFYENVVTKSLPESERDEQIVLYLNGTAFGFYFDRVYIYNTLTERAKDDGIVKELILEKFRTQKTETEIMR